MISRDGRWGQRGGDAEENRGVITMPPRLKQRRRTSAITQGRSVSIALGRLGWSLRRIKQATRMRREPARTYLKPQGLGTPPSCGGHSKTGQGVITDSGPNKPVSSNLHSKTLGKISHS